MSSFLHLETMTVLININIWKKYSEMEIMSKNKLNHLDKKTHEYECQCNSH